MHCPHYDQHTCYLSYQTCIHYQAAAQAKVLAEVNHQAGVTISKTHINPIITAKTPLFLPNRGITTVSGKLKSTINGKPLSGISIRIGDQVTTTDYYGKFQLSGVPKGTVAIDIEGNNIYHRRTVIKTNWLRSIQIDAPEKDSQFNLGFYRELARGNHPEEKRMYSIRRWTHKEAPMFYIDLNTIATSGKKIPSKTIRTIRTVIKKFFLCLAEECTT